LAEQCPPCTREAVIKAAVAGGRLPIQNSSAGWD
jgi:hypothetical protein